MAISTIDTSSISGLGYGFKNRIINGGMQIDQRNAGASVNSNGAYPVDRFLQLMSGGGVLTSQRSTTVPSDFSNSIYTTVSTADASIAAGDYYVLRHIIEGLNIADFNWGTANAAPVTLSFKVRSSVTGTFSGSLTNSAEDRSYPFTYTISAANTWTTISVTIAGDTSGTWLTTNGVGIRINFDLGTGSTRLGTANTWGSSTYFGATGSVQLISTLNATFYITGVQLEKGTVATSFDYRPYGTELSLCQRYYQVLASGGNKPISIGAAYTATSVYLVVCFRTTMRAAPTLSATSGTNYYIFYRNASNDVFNSVQLETSSTDIVELSNVTEISGTVGWSGMVRTSDAAAFIGLTSEL